jgi:hypothetical protein
MAYRIKSYLPVMTFVAFFFGFLFLNYYLFICVYIVWAISPPCPPSPFGPQLASMQILFCSLLQFCVAIFDLASVSFCIAFTY